MITKSIPVLSTVLIITAYVILLCKTAKKAVKQITKNKILDENALITISVIGAFLIGKEMEGAMVILLYEIGKILESKAVNKSRRSISELMNIKPEYANIKNGDNIETVTPDKVSIGDIIVVKSGEKIPLDGIVTKGEAQIDTSALTGESKLIDVTENSKVLSGSINAQGLLEIEVTSTYENSTVNKILQLVENATDKKAKTETFVSKAAKIYTPVVIGFAILVAIFMPILFNVTYDESIYKALVFLVISCPCSIAISVPLSYFSGIGKASKKGILIKGSDYLDGLKDIGTIVFDKTGTITIGNLEVEEINSYKEEISKKEILKYFAMGESFSNHPIAKSILKKADMDIDLSQVKNYEEISGKGIKYEFEGKTIKIGNAKFVEKESSQILGTVLYLKINDEVVGNIVLKDQIKPDAKQAITLLKQMNIKTHMFTGDKKEVAIETAKEVGIPNVVYEMLPADKYNKLEEVIKDEPKKTVFVGDGINDSPALAISDIGVSVNSGTDIAMDSSDVILTKNDLSTIINLINISKETIKNIKQNLFWAFFYNFLMIPVAIGVLKPIGISINPMIASLAMVLSSITVIINTLRLKKQV